MSINLRCFVLTIFVWGAVTSATEERDKLLVNIIEMHLNVTNFALEQSKCIASDLLQDAATSVEQKTSLANYVKDVESEKQQPPASESNIANRFLQLVAKSVIFQQFEAILAQQNGTNSSAESSLRANAREKYGLVKFERELEQRRLALMTTFRQLVANYISILTTQQKERSDSVLNWYANYEGTTDTRRINEMLGEFLKLV